MKQESPAKSFIIVAIIAFAVSILIFICIFAFDFSNVASHWHIVNEENSEKWLEYCIEYFGPIAASFIGFVSTIMAVFITIKHEDKCRKEDNRKEALPLLSVRLKTSKSEIDNGKVLPILDFADKQQPMLILPLSLSNVGRREMYSIWIGGVKHGSKGSKNYYNIAPILYKDDTISDIFPSSVECQLEEKHINITLMAYFKDCYNNWYYQTIGSRCAKRSSMSYVAEAFEIKSAPVLVEEKDLPEEIKS